MLVGSGIYVTTAGFLLADYECVQLCGIVVRAHASHAEGLRFESDSMPLLLAHCSPSSKWVLGGNTGEIKAARKGTGHLTSHVDGSG